MEYVGGSTATKAGSTSGTSTISLTSLTGGIASSAQAGDLVVAVFATGAAADRTLSITDGTNAYSLVGSELYRNGVSYDSNLRVAYKYLTGADASVTFGATGNNADAGAMAVHVWRGVDPDTPLDVAAVTASNTGSARPDCGSITPVTAGAIVICVGGGAAATGAAFTAAELSNFITTTSADTNDAMVGVGSYDWSSGAFDPVQWSGGSATSADSWTAITFALRPAQIALAGDAADVASATGALTTQIPLAGAALVVASSTADLTTGGAAAELAGNATAQAVATAQLTTQIPLSGVAVTVTSASGTLTAQIRLSAAALTQAVAAAALGTGIPLAAGAQGSASASGSLDTGIKLAAQAVAQAAASGSLTTAINLIGAAVANAVASAALGTPGAALEGGAQAQPAGSAVLTAQIRLDAAAVVQAAASGGISTGIILGGNAPGQAAAGATLTASIRLSADALAVAIATGEFAADIPLTGDAIASATAIASLTVNPPLASDLRFVARRASRGAEHATKIKATAGKWRVAANQHGYRIAA